MDVLNMQDRCFKGQWSVDDIDWDAPGREKVTPENAKSLKGFLSDVVWIEYIAALIFQGMADYESDPTLKAIFETFVEDETRHYQAELRLMQRWGMIKKGEMPTPNPNAAKLARTLEYSKKFVSPSVMSALVPVTELVLDGALIRYLTEVVDDPLCLKVFEKINSDEARHLQMDFFILEKYGRERSPFLNSVDIFKTIANPLAAYALCLGYVPMLSRTRKTIVNAGLSMDKIKACIKTYQRLGDRNPNIARHPMYQLCRQYLHFYSQDNYQVGNAMCKLSDSFDKTLEFFNFEQPMPKIASGTAMPQSFIKQLNQA